MRLHAALALSSLHFERLAGCIGLRVNSSGRALGVGSRVVASEVGLIVLERT